MNLSVIVASCDRPSLAAAMRSASSQMHEGDEVLVAVNQDCPWGHKARNHLMRAARGDYLLFMDDDDAYVPGALDVVRAAVEQDKTAGQRMHLFRMQYANGAQLWADPTVRLGNVSTQMVVVPWGVTRMFASCRWNEDLYEGDYHFIAACADRVPTAWHEEVIALVRPVMMANL